MIVIYLGLILLLSSSELLLPAEEAGLLLHQTGFTTSQHLCWMRGFLGPHFSLLPRFRRLPLKRRNIVSVALSLFSRTVGVTHCLFYLAVARSAKADYDARTFLLDYNRGNYLAYLGIFILSNKQSFVNVYKSVWVLSCSSSA